MRQTRRHTMYYFKKFSSKVTTMTGYINPHKWGFIPHNIPFSRDRSKKIRYNSRNKEG